MTEQKVLVTNSTGTKPQTEERAKDQAAFTKAISKVDEGPGVGAKQLGDDMKSTARRVQASPEQIWYEGNRHKERRDKEAAARTGLQAVKDAVLPTAEPDKQAAPPAKESEEAQDEPNPEFDRAKNALIRSGFKHKELSTMSREEVLKRGLARARALDADDAAHELAKTAKATPTKTDTSTSGQQKKLELPDLKSALAPVAKQLLLDDEGATALEKAFNDILTPIVSKLGAEQQPAPKADTGTLAAVETTRKELSGMFPQLVDPRTFESVVEQMDYYAQKSAKYSSMPSAQDAFRALMQDACTVLGLEREETEEKDQGDQDERQVRRHSRSTPTGRMMSRTVTSNPDRAAFDHIRANPGDVRGAQRVIGR